MKLWIIITLFGELVGAQGPLDSFLDTDSCNELIAEYREAITDPPPGTRDERGRLLTRDAVDFECVWADERPFPKGGA